MTDRNRVVISGTSSGIDRATAVRFAEDGYNVCLNTRREQQLNELIASLPDGDHLVCPGDYSNPDSVAAMAAMIGNRWGSVDVLVWKVVCDKPKTLGRHKSAPLSPSPCGCENRPALWPP